MKNIHFIKNKKLKKFSLDPKSNLGSKTKLTLKASQDVIKTI